MRTKTKNMIRNKYPLRVASDFHLLLSTSIGIPLEINSSLSNAHFIRVMKYKLLVEKDTQLTKFNLVAIFKVF